MQNKITPREERIAMVKAMEFIARQVNDESILDGWLLNGVADGDIPYMNFRYTDCALTDPAVDYADFDLTEFADLMTTFLRVMNRARKSGGLYCGGVTSAVKPADETPFCHICWNNDDLREMLKASNLPATDDNVWALRNELEYGRHRLTEDMISAGWGTVQNAITFLRRESHLKEYDKA